MSINKTPNKSPSQLKPEQITAARERVQPLRNIYKMEKKLHRNRISLAQLKSWIKTLQKAEDIIRRIDPFFRKEQPMNQETGRRFGTNNTLNHLHDTRTFLSSLPKGGRPPKETLGQCASGLAKAFRESTGTPQWKEVGNILAEWFPQDRDEYKESEVHVWAYNLAHRYERIHTEKQGDHATAEATWDLIQRD